MISSPNSDEVEITFIGPGYGECILLHVTQNEWIIVDSCVDQGKKVTPALEYLQKIGVDPSVAVKLIVASHWHDDHIRGLASIYEACINAEFALSVALSSEEFLSVAAAFGKRAMMEGSSGVMELHKILSLLLKSKTSGERPFKPPIWAAADKCIFADEKKKWKVFSLSPSDWAITEAKKEIATLIPKEGQAIKWLVTSIPNANHVAVVLWIEINGNAILLGSDLEEEGKDYTGWSAIVKSAKRPDGKAILFKIPHHGSITAHLPDIWSELLHMNPVSVCTPYSRGKALPSIDDVKRICENTTEAYITSTKKVAEIKKDPVAEKMISEMKVKIKPRPIQAGFVRIRFKENEPENYRIELFEGAAKLK